MYPRAPFTMALWLLGVFALTLVPGLVADAPERIAFCHKPFQETEEAERADHQLAPADRVNNTTGGCLDHVLPQVRPRREGSLSHVGLARTSGASHARKIVGSARHTHP
jgi:hypothetical protein